MILLLFFFTGSIRRSVHKATDLARMRQLHVATELFGQDHPNQGRIFMGHDAYEDRYGYGLTGWYHYLRPYLNARLDDNTTEVAAFIATGDPSHGAKNGKLSHPDFAYLRRSYSFNTGTLDTYSRTYTWKKNEIAKPGELLFFCSHRAGEEETHWIDIDIDYSRDAIPRDWYDGSSALFAFLDGHIESIPVEEVLPGGVRNHIFKPVLIYHLP